MLLAWAILPFAAIRQASLWDWPVFVGVGIALLIWLGFYGVMRALRVVSPPSLLTGWELALKCLMEGNTPVASLEFVAEWGTSPAKEAFRESVLQLRNGANLADALQQLAALEFQPRIELIRTTLLMSEKSPEVVTGTCRLIATRTEQGQQCQTDTEAIIAGARQWVLVLVVGGLLLAAMLIIALPQYSSALLQTSAGRGLLGVMLGLELAGILWSGLLLRIQQRLLEAYQQQR